MKKLLTGGFAVVLLILIIPCAFAQETAEITSAIVEETVSSHRDVSVSTVVEKDTTVEEEAGEIIIGFPREDGGGLPLVCGDGMCNDIICEGVNCRPGETHETCPEDCGVALDTCGDGACSDVTCEAIGCPAAETPENCPEDCGPRAKIIGEPIEEPAPAPPEVDDDQETSTGRIKEKKAVEIRKVRSYTVVVDAPMPERVRGATGETATGEVEEEEKTVSDYRGRGITIGLPAESEAIAGLAPIAAPKGIEVKIEAVEDYTAIESGEVRATTRRRISVRKNKVFIETAAAEKREIKIMPSRVKEIMEARAGKVPSTAAELEVGDVETPSGILRPKITVKKIELAVEEDKPVYNVESEEDGKLFAFIPVKLKVKSKVDATSGIVEQTKRPWWSFLVFGQMKKAD